MALGIVVLLCLLVLMLVHFRVHGRDSGESSSRNAVKVDYSCQFPPSRHDTLASLQGSKSPIPSSSTLQRHALPTTRTPDFSNNNQYTPTGFSIHEIKTLGPFPDYAVLSGVPHPRPCPQFNIQTACFRPFRPFRWTYHQTMSLMKLDPDYWVELDSTYYTRLDQRRKLRRQHGRDIMDLNPGAELAARELMEVVLQNVTIRYPHLFCLEEGNTVFVNRLLDTKVDLTTTPPLDVLFDNIPEDYAIMLRNENDGLYYLRGGMICSSIGWNFGEKFNKPLAAIHEPVVDYKAKMAFSMDRFFAKMPTDAPIQRGSWNIVDDNLIYLAPGATPSPRTNVSIEECNLRVDFQTLRRLPLSGAIVFDFKVAFTPLTELKEEPYIPSLLRKQLDEAKPALTAGKIYPHLRETVIDALCEWEGYQIGKGMMSQGWEVGTLAESPFYPGWEGRWRGRVGFEI
ncbi:hypothetical protein BDV25DRAFT_171261 [Aspergillus avenaceus]|uniref:HRQ family protein n=1 Tax=Aspergillus avenaceus TaxID=36643 RepID=A0A5N6U0B4_ASPAV|nr:hypothetical protein BDV25DRAFT_171261 [Aspergillus avenaceus]